MKTLIRAMLTTLMMVFLVASGHAVGSAEFLSGLYTPTDNATLHRLMASGLNTVIFNRFNDNIALVSALDINKIGACAINPRHTEQPVAQVLAAMEQALALLGGQNPISYLIGGDLEPKEGLPELVDAIAGMGGLSHPMVMFAPHGGLKKWEWSSLIRTYAPDYDIMTYHYSFMRQSLPFSDLLKKYRATSVAVQQHQSAHYAITQAHNQDWFSAVVEKAGKDPVRSGIYPDGQLVRLAYYLGVASGAQGVFAYNDGETFSLTGPGRERVLGLAQAMEEIKPLLPHLRSATSVLFRRPNPALYGTKVIGDDVDILFLFSEDSWSTYHPWAKTGTHIKSSVLMDAAGYPNGTYRYARESGLKPLYRKVYVSQDHPVILIGLKNDKVLPGEFAPDAAALSQYVATLKERSRALASNIKLFFDPQIAEPNLEGRDDLGSARALLNYIDKLNDAKRTQWQAQSPSLFDGDSAIYELAHYGEILTVPSVPINFYCQ